MGRPLLSTLITSAAPSVRIAEPEPSREPGSKLPTYERWSYINAFDPDADEFFEGDNVVYEAFLSPEEIAEQERAQLQARDNNTPPPEVSRVDVEVSTQVPIFRSRVLRAIHAVRVPGEDERPELLSPTGDDSSSSGSDTVSSGRASPAETDELLDASRMRRVEINVEWSGSLDVAGLEEIPSAPSFVSAASLARSLPSTPTRRRASSWVSGSASPSVFSRTDTMSIPTSSEPIDIPASPMPHPAQAVVASPMTPPGSVTPRFLTWDRDVSTRPRAIDMSPSPAPVESTRASRMSVAYISPPALRVTQ